MSKFLLISVKPEYATQIIDKKKTIELRKNRPNVRVGDYILIYATIPIKAIIGFGKIKRIIECSPEKMWADFSHLLGMKKVDFDLYYLNVNKAIGIEVSSICKLRLCIHLSQIKLLFPKFSPPQTYRYLSAFKALRIFKAISS